jgi:glycosyltransferase involved in cell wall biosynthesis
MRLGFDMFCNLNYCSNSALTFVLPGDGRSGGVRVTVSMANLLRARGHKVRIACPFTRVSLRNWFSNILRLGSVNTGFLQEFTGPVAHYQRLDDLNFDLHEIVIAVGTYSLPDVRTLKKPVIKLRYNHGFPAKPDALQDQAWRGNMPTITVSRTLVPRLEELSGEKVLGVVPNGIDTRMYFPEPDALHNGIGAVINHHPNKAPEDMKAVLAEAHRRWPHVQQYLFSTERKPARLTHADYTRLPSVGEARAIYNRCKIWLLTSHTEGLPGVVLEAMACGCVVISTDNDGSLEIIRHGHNGLIVPRGDVPAFLREIERVLSDNDLARRLAACALATAQEFTWERAADKMEQQIYRLLAGSSTEILPLADP